MSNEPSGQNHDKQSATYVSTGITGLDIVLKGGFLQKGLYLLEGDPGSGKTTVGLQYLLHHYKNGEPVLYIAMTESRRDLEMICDSHGWALEDLELLILVKASLNPIEQSQRSIFDPSETQLGELIQAVVAEIDRVKPSHLVFDGLAELRLLAGSQLTYRRQLISLKLFLVERGVTTLLLDDGTTSSTEISAHQSIVGGTIILESHLPQYGRARRRLYIGKVRCSDFKEGFHDYEITADGLLVYPRLVAPEHLVLAERRMQSSGVANLDLMFKGGLLTGTSSVFIGPSGVGKSTVAMQFVATALKLGFKAAVYTFDEVLATFIGRSEKINFQEPGALQPYIEDGRLILRQIDPAELTPGSFAQEIRDAVDGGASIIIIDSLNGYINSMPEEKYLSTHLHELVSYLNQKNVITIMVVAQHGVLRGTVVHFNVSYLADTVLLFRYFEETGKILRGVTVFKNRTGPHENTMREMVLTDKGIVIGAPLTEIRKLATGALYEDPLTVEPFPYQDMTQQ